MEKRKLELAFIDKKGKAHPIDDVTRAELAEGLEKISRSPRDCYRRKNKYKIYSILWPTHKFLERDTLIRGGSARGKYVRLKAI